MKIADLSLLCSHLVSSVRESKIGIDCEWILVVDHYLIIAIGESCPNNDFTKQSKCVASQLQSIQISANIFKYKERYKENI